MTDSPSPLLRLPEELIESILHHLPPRATVACGATCTQLQKLTSEPLLWRYYCLTIFPYWHDQSSLTSDLSKPAPATDWSRRFVDRIKRDGHNMELFESLLETQQGRLGKIEEIAQTGYEAREMLKGYMRAEADLEDVLARRYWAEATLGLLNRTEALKIWDRLGAEDRMEAGSAFGSAAAPGPGLEESLTAFDLFVLGTRQGDPESIGQAMDKIAAELRRSLDDFEELDLEQKCVAIVRSLRDNGVVGNVNDAEYHAMQNNFLSHALLDDDRSSLPLQSTAIFVGVAKRLGITATACNFPTHIYSMVPTPQPRSETDPWPDHTSGQNVIYMDPWRQDGVVDADILLTQLQAVGIPTGARAQYLAPALPRDMVLRTGRNIMRSWEEQRRGALETNPDIDHDLAFYSFLWSVLLVGGNENREMNIHRRRSYLPYLLETFQHNFPEDVGLVEHYISRMFQHHPQKDDFFKLTTEMRTGDQNARPVMHRDGKAVKVKYKIGQLFQHKRYGYVGVIVGWDPKCSAGEPWIAQMSVDQLPMGRAQSFYHILSEDKSKRYVAEENINLMYVFPSDTMLKLAGRYFKRWDSDTRMFVSNLRDEYPDD